MPALPLKDQFRPTLADLLTPWWRGATCARRRLAVAAAASVVVLAAALAILYPRDGWIVHHGGAVSFSLQYPRAMHRVPPPAGAFARVEERSGGILVRSFQVGPLRLPPYRGEISGELPLFAVRYIAGLAARTPGFLLASEGRTRVDVIQGYTITYSAIDSGRAYFGRVVFLLPRLTAARDGVTLTMTTIPTSLVYDPDQVAVNDSLFEPLHSFRFST